MDRLIIVCAKMEAASVAQLDARRTGDQVVACSTTVGSATFFRAD